jgi:hypothetical protein
VTYLARQLAEEANPAFDRCRQTLIALHRELADEPSRVALLELYAACCERETGARAHAHQPVEQLARQQAADMRDFCLAEASVGKRSVDPVELQRVVTRELAAGRIAPSRFTTLAEAGANVFGRTIHQPSTPSFLSRLFAERPG